MLGSSRSNPVTNTILFKLLIRSFAVGSSLLLATHFAQLEYLLLYMGTLFILTLAFRIYEESQEKLVRLSLVYYDGDCRFCVRTLRILALIFKFKHVRFIRGDFDPEINSQMNNENSWIVQDSSGSLHFRSTGLRVLLRTSHYRFGSTRMFDLATRMVQTPLDNLYNLIAEHRAFLSKLISCK